MCGRYLIANDDSGDLEEINRIVEALNTKYHGGHSKVKTGEIFPTDDAPVILANGDGIKNSLMKWGFLKWKGSGVIINARSEGAREKKILFAEPLKHRRCVIPSSGYFEWRTDGKSKTKFLFRMDGVNTLYMAGLFTDERFVILTTAANKYVDDIHSRMPVVLHKEEILSWLNDDSYIDRAFDRENIKLEKYCV